MRARFAAGDETDLREIREHRPGDPFRRIAWRPSARTGRLMTKEYERYLPRRHLLAVDASASTLRRVGGRAPLDELAAEAHARKGDAADAVAMLNRAMSHYGVNAVLLNALGDSYAGLGDRERALESYERSLETSGDQPEVRKKIEALKKRRP